MKIHVITVAYNEEKLMPLFLRHYAFADLITVFDNNSTDKTVEIVRSFPNTIVYPLHTNETFDDVFLLNVKNNHYREDRTYDWVIVVDVDEFLYHPGLVSKLSMYSVCGVTIPLTSGYDMYSKEFPTNPGDIIFGRPAENHSKSVIFNPKDLDINYRIGCHQCDPIGTVKYSFESELKVLHLVYMSYEYMTKKRANTFRRLSERNLQNGWSTHNKSYGEMTKEEFDSLESSMVKVI